MRPKDKFGDLLRSLREPRMSMGQLARNLGVPVSYISDVERGNRPPLTADRIAAVAKCLEIDPTELFLAATESRGAFELDARVPMRQQMVGMSLARSWPTLSTEAVEEIAATIEKDQQKGKR